jgi:hypothetical protein
MKIEKNSELLFCSLSFRRRSLEEWEWVGKIGEREIIGETLEDCFRKMIAETNAIEFEFVPQKFSYNEVGSYMVILKTEN